jgi:hypothetical protein
MLDTRLLKEVGYLCGYYSISQLSEVQISGRDTKRVPIGVNLSLKALVSLVHSQV